MVWISSQSSVPRRRNVLYSGPSAWYPPSTCASCGGHDARGCARSAAAGCSRLTSGSAIVVGRPSAETRRMFDIAVAQEDLLADTYARLGVVHVRALLGAAE